MRSWRIILAAAAVLCGAAVPVGPAWAGSWVADAVEFWRGPVPDDDTPADPTVFASLFAGLPTQDSRGRPLAAVSFIGVAETPGAEGALETWLHPMRLDLAALDRDLAAALRQRYDARGAISSTLERELFEAAQARRAAVWTVDERALMDFAPSPQQIAGVNQAKESEAVVAVRVRQTWSWPGAIVVEARLYGGRSTTGVFEATSVVHVPRSAGDYDGWNPRAAVVLVALLALVPLIPRGKGHGGLTVEIERSEDDPDITYTAYVGVTTLRDGTSGKHVLGSAGIKTRRVAFSSLPAQALRVAVRRVQRDPKTLKVEDNQLLEKEVQIPRGDRATVRFDFTSTGIPVTLSLRHGEEDPVEASSMVAIEGRGDSTRYLRDGAGVIELRHGSHTLLVGVLGRAFRVPVRIPEKARELAVAVDVDQLDRAVFRDCEPAVVPWVGGDWAAAADALEAAGQAEPAALLRAEDHRRRGDLDKAATVFESTGRLREAAELRAETGDAEGTAELLERAQDWRGAGEQHQRNGQFDAAARAFARADLFDEALSCAAQSGDRGLFASVLERKGDHLEAARVCLEIDDVERAIRLLQAVALSHPTYGEASLLLAQLFNAREEPELALQKLDEAIDVFGSESSLELREQIARQLERKNNLALALEAYEHIRKRDIEYPGVAEKIDEIREKLRGEAQEAGASGDPVAPADSSGRYELQEEIGRGGMGVVFKARDRTLGRAVAYKRLPESLAQHEAAVKFFVREAQSAAALNHPNIVTLYDAGQEGGIYYLTMELLEGLPLNDILSRRGHLDVGLALKVAIQAAEGLAYAHAENIVHRDIKPSNLFVTKTNRVKIMDFGLAKMVEEVRKKTTMIAGTPHYMAPEQASGAGVDQRADLYAFGVTLWELLVGEVPYNEGDVAYHRLHTAPPDLRERLPECPAALAELVTELMAKLPDQRPSAAETLDRLQRILNG